MMRLLLLVGELLVTCVNGAALMEKLGAYVMQAAETSPVNWNGRILLIQGVSGNTPGVYDCCHCLTYGCVANRSAPIGYADCSGCTCSALYKAQHGSCAPQFFQVVDYESLEVLVSPIPGTEGFGFASATVHAGKLWVYGTNLVNKTNGAPQLWCFSSAEPTSPSADRWERREALTVPAGFSVFNTDVHHVLPSRAGQRRHIMVIETNLFENQSLSWTLFFAESKSSTPDRGWQLLPPSSHFITKERMNACPSIRYFDGFYYVATTTEGDPCPPAGWGKQHAALCVILYRSRSLQYGDWQLGNERKPIVYPGDDDRRVLPAWHPTSAERDAVMNGPPALGDINDSDFDFCDTADGNVLGIFAGIANQQSNPYFNIAAIARNTTSAEWLASYFDSKRDVQRAPPTPPVASKPLLPVPPMGWMSWLRFLCDTDCITHPDSCINEQLFQSTADALVQGGFKTAGYARVHIDDCWASRGRDRQSQALVADPVRFPSGMRNLSEYVRARGISLASYGDQGVKTCAGFPGSKGHEHLDASSFTSWGIDYLKYDGCFPLDGSKTPYPCNRGMACFREYSAGYAAMGKALHTRGNNIIYSCSWPAYLGDDETGKPWDAIVAAGCNLWRTWTDVTCTYERSFMILDHFGNFSEQLAQVAGPQRGWNDPDALIVGNGCITGAEEETQMALFCILAAPLIMGNDVRNIASPRSRATLLNSHAIAVNQDPAGLPGFRVSPYSATGIELWARRLQGGDVAVAMVNKGNHSADAILQFDMLAKKGFTLDADWCTLFDIFANRWVKGQGSRIPCRGNLSFPAVEPHGVIFLRASRQTDIVSV